MSNTSNFDFCVELVIDAVRAIFHLAFKEEDRFPHNIGPLPRTYSGQQMNVSVLVLDDDTDPADLTFAQPQEIDFSFPLHITVEIPNAPDPSLSRIVLQTRVNVPASLTFWQEDGEDVLGLSFEGIDASKVSVTSLEGVPVIGASNYKAAIDAQYLKLPHTYTLGGNLLLLYDGALDPGLQPTNTATPSDIQVLVQAYAGDNYLGVTLPIYIEVPQAYCKSFGRIVFYRKIANSDTAVSVDFSHEPAANTAPAVDIQIDNPGPGGRDAAQVILAQLKPLALSAIDGFGVITAPAFTDAGARAVLQAEAASYLADKRFPVYSPKSGDPSLKLSTPVGFLLVAEGVLSILMNRRDSSVADSAPDDFLGGSQLALAMSRAKFDEFIQDAIQKQFPDLVSGNQEVNTKQGSATLHTLSVSPSDAGDHGQSQGHLWVTGTATVHIDCWPDPDVSFDGPIFLHATVTETDTECSFQISAQAGKFNFDESCCTVFLDLIVPIVGWIALGVSESLINSVGGELADDIASKQADKVRAIPPTINGIAEVQACLQNVLVSSQGIVLPGHVRIRRLGTSFEDLQSGGHLPRY